MAACFEYLSGSIISSSKSISSSIINIMQEEEEDSQEKKSPSCLVWHRYISQDAALVSHVSSFPPLPNLSRFKLKSHAFQSLRGKCQRRYLQGAVCEASQTKLLFLIQRRTTKSSFPQPYVLVQLLSHMDMHCFILTLILTHTSYTILLVGFYQGGWITVIRDAPSYGIYFWVYEGMKRILELDQSQNSSDSSNAWKLLVAGGMAGAVSWSSIYPIDVIKSRLQMQVVSSSSSSSSSLSSSSATNRAMPSIANVTESTIHQSRLVRQYHGSQATTQNGSVTQSTGSINNTAQLSEAALLTGRSERPYTSIKDCIIRSYRAEGPSVFVRGLLPTIVRGFPVNAVTFYVYEVVMEMLSRN